MVGFLMVVAPGEGEIALDALTHIVRSYPDARIFLRDDCTQDGTFEKLWDFAVAHPGRVDLARNGSPHGFKGIAVSTFRSFERICQTKEPLEMVIQLDPDVLLLGDGLIRFARSKFAQYGPGIIGSYTRSASGSKRSHASHRNHMLADLLPAGFDRHHRRVRVGFPFYARYLPAARRNGYRLGEHVLGAFYIVHGDTLHSLHRAGFWGAIPELGCREVKLDDPLVSLGASIVGHKLIDLHDAADSRFWIQLQNPLPLSAEEIVRRGYLAVHPAKTDSVGNALREKLAASRRNRATITNGSGYELTSSQGIKIAATPSRPVRGILTIAFGKPEYVEMAKSLARSLTLHTPEVARAVVTDSDDAELMELFDFRIAHRPEYGSNLRQKMYLDQYSPFDRTLFLDSDSLAVRNLGRLWSAFEGSAFGACGYHTLRAGDNDEFVDVNFILDRFHLKGLPKFNGGVYYFDSSPEAAMVFSTARDLLRRARELRFSEIRGDGPNDEALYSVAMAMHGLTVTDIPAGGMWTPINKKGPLRVDILSGQCTFEKAGRVVSPDILHFAMFAESFTYLRECLKLRYVATGRGQVPYARLLMLRMEVLGLWVVRRWKNLQQRRRRPAPISRILVRRIS